MIVWITHVKVGHRQTPYKRNSPPREGFCVYGGRCDLLQRSDLARESPVSGSLKTASYTVCSLTLDAGLYQPGAVRAKLVCGTVEECRIMSTKEVWNSGARS